MRRIIFVLFCLALPLRASAEKILITADPQYGWFASAGCEKEREYFRKIIDIVNDGKFDALVILGDLADSYPRMRTSRARQVALLLDDLKRVKSARVYLVAGNHDLGDDAPDWAIREFESVFRVPTRYAFRIGGYKFLALNSTLIQNSERRPREYREQLDFIRQNADARFVLVHHPPFIRDPKERDGYYPWRAKPRKEILPLFAPGTFIFSGHTHLPFRKAAGGLYNIGVGTCCAPWRHKWRTYGVLEVAPGTIRYEEKVLP